MLFRSEATESVTVSGRELDLSVVGGDCSSLGRALVDTKVGVVIKEHEHSGREDHSKLVLAGGSVAQIIKVQIERNGGRRVMLDLVGNDLVADARL